VIPADFDWQAPNYDAVYEHRLESLTRIREPGFDIDALKAYYKDHPADFCEDWMSTSDPRNAERGLPVVVPFLLFPKQRDYLGWLRDRWLGREDGLVEKSRDVGASWLTAAFAVWMFTFHPNTVFGIGSRKEVYVDAGGNPASIFWKVRMLLDTLPQELQPKGFDMRAHSAHMRLVNPENGAAIVGEAGDSIGRGNRTSCYLLDEAAFLERPELADAALSQTSNCRISVSTPNGAGNVFFRKRHGGKIKVFTFDWRDDPRKDIAWYRHQCEILDPVVIAQEVDRDYTASVSNSFVPGVTVTAAQLRGPMDVNAMGPVIVGVDPARFGDDSTAITFRQGRMVFPQIVFGKADVVDVAGRVTDAIRLWPERVSQIAVDTIGIGAGVADVLRRTFGDIVQDVNSSLRLDDGECYNLRARMWRDMRDWIKAGASLPNDPELFISLTSLSYEYRAGLLLIESKDAMKKRGMKSPDRADSIALTFAYPPKQPEPELEVPDFGIFDELTAY
jgi:phage terminase large subunit